MGEVETIPFLGGIGGFPMLARVVVVRLVGGSNPGPAFLSGCGPVVRAKKNRGFRSGLFRLVVWLKIARPLSGPLPIFLLPRSVLPGSVGLFRTVLLNLGSRPLQIP